MKPEVAQRRIESFRKRFGEAHLMFAYHAAFPLALTPDLLYKLWANFQRDIHGRVLGIPWVAVADLLLSSLCDEVGHELYEMDAAMRNLLLSQLKEDVNFGQQRINQLSDFLLAYVRQQLNSSDPDVRDFAQVQRWTALAYVKPSEAAQELALALKNVCQQHITRTDKTEIVRIASLVETFSEPLATFKPLLVFARGVSKFACGDLEGAATELKKVKKVSRQTRQIENSWSTHRQTSEKINSSIDVTTVADKSLRSKLVFLRLGSGNFDQGFPVTLYIGEEGASFHTSLDGRLPPNPQIPSLYTTWQSESRHFLNPPIVVQSLGLREKPTTQQRTTYSIVDVNEKAEDLIKNLNQWLNSETFRPIKDKLQQKLNRDDTVRVIIQTEDSLLWQLPWYLWDLLDNYPKAEVGLSLPKYDQAEPINLTLPKERLRILAILGHQYGIDLQADLKLLQSLPRTEVMFLVEPQKSEINDQLWGQAWDIIFFAGHSETEGETGRIYINPTESILIEELWYGLKKAVERGLKLAIFNSCDGLKLAEKLDDLNIPQIIVMREPVPDLVAQEFLRYFLSSFSRGQHLYPAVREARERLHDASEKNFPGAYWLPVLFSNPATIPPTWEDLISQGVDDNKSVSLNQWLQGIVDEDWESFEDFLSSLSDNAVFRFSSHPR